jgi:radical SAM protein with 4Fe4S-binding SPASM domain
MELVFTLMIVNIMEMDIIGLNHNQRKGKVVRGVFLILLSQSFLAYNKGDNMKQNIFAHHKRKEYTKPKENKTYKEYRKNWIEYPKKFYVSDFPLHLDIELTNACNLQCPMCYKDVMKDKNGFMTWELFEKIILEASSWKCPSINLSWRGEPLLHPDFYNMVSFAKKQGIIDVRVNTNLTLLKYPVMMTQAGIDKVIVSIDASKRETYEQIRQGADFNKVVDNINCLLKVKSILSKKPLVELQFLVMRQNFDEQKEFTKQWKDKVDAITFVTYRNPTGKEYDNFRAEPRPREQFPCPQLWQRLTIGWNGKVYMCCGDNRGDIVLGDANTDSLHQIWTGNELNLIRNYHREGEFGAVQPCKDCEFNRK